MRNGKIVHDVWWPWRFGKIIKITATRMWVRWVGGEVWKYDKAHQKFLRSGEAI